MNRSAKTDDRRVAWPAHERQAELRRFQHQDGVKVDQWHYRGDERPPFAVVPEPGFESVWDYPRPPRVDHDERHIEVRTESALLAEARRALRVCETAGPPTFYLRPEDLVVEELAIVPGTSFCEWKGVANYLALAPGEPPVAWFYPSPNPAYAELVKHVAFYPGRVACFVDGERVRPQPGGFYGGWITDELVGPFKGEPGTEHW